jgi:hypothetical protein
MFKMSLAMTLVITEKVQEGTPNYLKRPLLSFHRSFGKGIRKTELEGEDSHGVDIHCEDISEELTNFYLLLSIVRDCQHK